MPLQSVAGSHECACWTAVGNLGAESAGAGSLARSPRRLLAAGQRDRSEEQWRVGYGRRAEGTSGRSADSKGVEGIARALRNRVQLGGGRSRPDAQRAGRTWETPKLIRSAQYEQTVMWRLAEQTSRKIDRLRAYATYDRWRHLSPNVVSHIWR